ncbi:MAG: Cell division protein ZapE [Gammaproteobacteria bacterium]|nr:Cell division protein ZapE [Gammaproteobacteria bacterium]
MTPLEKYRQDLQRDGFIADRTQRRAVKLTEHLFQQLLQASAAAGTVPRAGWLDRLLRRPAPAGASRAPRGLYLWGGVGRGKTYVVDAFYECLPFQEKARAHFHGFMRRVHQELRTLGSVQNPLDSLAERIARNTRVLCFDEFHVSDITDAMLLGNLLRALFGRGITLVATSNEQPDRLYWGGLQRERFLPAIEVLKAHTEVFHFDGETDYRLRALERAEIYHTPLDDAANAGLLRTFESIAPDTAVQGGAIEIEGREIATIRRADGVVWFDFDTICAGPRAVADYIEIARQYQTVLVSSVPVVMAQQDDAARRFVHLVDEFYDRNVKLIVSAAALPNDLYGGERLAAMFARTASRLHEMQSHEYLARPHISD